MNSIACDDPEYIAKHVGSLADLTKLARERSGVVNDPTRDEKMPRWLHAFVVLGRYVLPAEGGVYVLSKPISDPDMPNVVPMEEVKRYLYRGESIGYALTPMPSEDDVCVRCYRAFTLTTAPEGEIDAIARHGDDRAPFVHRACAWIARAREHRTRFQDVFRDAGFKLVYLGDIPNGYWPPAYAEESMCTPWYRAHTDVGILTIGWRKSVIHIDWTTTGAKLLHLFASEDTTKEDTMVHAWGYPKAVDYLRRIREAL